MTLNLAGKNPYTGLLSKFSPQFQQFVKDLGDAKSKGEEDRIVLREAAFLKEAIRKPGVTSKQQKEHIVRLIYCDMLGADVSFSHMEAVKFAQQPNLLEKRVAYSAICLFLDEKNGSECMMMNTGTVQRDLSSTNILEVCFGLLAASKVVYKDVMPAVLPLVKDLIKHKREVVRKKAVMTLLKFYEIDANQEKDYVNIFQSILCDKDPAVMGVSLNGFHKFILEDPASFKILVASFVSILKQIIEKKLPDEFNFKGVPAPWMQIKLLQILALLGSDDIAMSKMMYEILTQCLNAVDTEQGIGCAVVYECMKTIATIYPNRALVEIAAGKAALFLVSDNYNLKYLGINALSDFINVDMSYGTRHQMVVIECLTDDDESIKRKTLDLLYRMTNGSNVKFICERLIIYLKSTVDEYVKSDLVLRITTLAEKYAPDNEWFIETMNEVFELGGDLVPVKVAYNMMAIIGEGIDDDEECDDATEDLRRYAMMSYISILDKPVLPDILIQLACWVVGEYFDLIEDYDAEDITQQLYKLLHRRFHDPLTQSWVISAIMKIVCRADEPTKLIQDIDLSLLTDDARQRYHEMKSVIKICDNLEVILPYDASCEDIEVDERLTFLDGFVARAIQNGADVYSADRMYTKKSDEKDDENTCATLRFGAYEEPYRRFQKDSEVLTTTTQKPQMEKEKPIEIQDIQIKDRSKVKRWTNKGYVGSHSKGESEVCTPASSESSSVKTEESIGVLSADKLIEEKGDEIIPSPNKSIKDEMAQQLFPTSNNIPNTQRKSFPTSSNIPTTQRKRKGVPRKPKTEKTTEISKTNEGTLDLLDLGDIREPMTSSMIEWRQEEVPNTLEPNISNDSILNLTDVSDSGLHPMKVAVDSGVLPPDINTLNIVENNDEIFNKMEINKPVQNNVLLTNEPKPSSTLSLHTEITQMTPVNLMDDEVYDPDVSNISNIYQPQTETDNTQDANATTIPEELTQYKHSPNPIEICSSNHMRVTCQYIYQPTELTIVFYLINQSTYPLTEIQLVTKLPSNLKAISAPIDFHSKQLDGMTSRSHVVSIVCSSPALHMVLSGNLIYRDTSNTEKRIFLNHVLPMSTLIRPLDINVEGFGGRWQERSLYTKKGKLDVKTNDVNQFVEGLEDVHLHAVEVIGNEIICAASMLNKHEILLHFKLSQLGCEITIKSESTLLNDCVMKMLSSIT